MTRTFFTRSFWADTFERAVKTSAQTVVTGAALSNATPIDGFALSPALLGGFALGGFLFSVLTSIASAPLGERGSASVR